MRTTESAEEKRGVREGGRRGEEVRKRERGRRGEEVRERERGGDSLWMTEKGRYEREGGAEVCRPPQGERRRSERERGGGQRSVDDREGEERSDREGGGGTEVSGPLRACMEEREGGGEEILGGTTDHRGAPLRGGI